MRIYHKTFRCSETFPASQGDEWNVKECGKVVEHWCVISKHSKSFTVRITEYVSPES